MEHLAVVEDVIRDIVTRVEQLEAAEIENSAAEVRVRDDALGCRKRGLSLKIGKQVTRKRGCTAERELGRLQFEKPVAYQQPDGCLTCEACDVSFASPTQQNSHDALFHRDATADDTFIDYHCSLCDNSFDTLSNLLLHSGCVDRRKLRLAAGDMAVCLLCGWALKRADLFDHLIVEHSNELSEQLPNIFPIECHFCSPTLLLKSAPGLLFHTAIWHFVNVAVRLQRIEPPQLCKLCNELIPAAQFRQHVVSVHISAAKQEQLPSPPEQPKQGKAKKSFVLRKKVDSIENVVSAVIAEQRTSQPSKLPIGRRCARCRKQFDSGPALANHKVMQQCQPAFRIVCPFCVGVGSRLNLPNRQMWKHVTVDHDHRMMQAMGSNRDSWARQVCGIGKEYRGGGRVACSFCPLRFDQDDTRRLHIALLHPGKKIPSDRPQSANSTSSTLPSDNKRFVFPTPLPSPKLSSPKFRCLLCGAKFHTFFTLNLHRQTFHDAISEQNSVLQRVLLAVNDTTGVKFRLDDNVMGIARTAMTDYWKASVINKRRELQGGASLRSRGRIL